MTQPAPPARAGVATGAAPAGGDGAAGAGAAGADTTRPSKAARTAAGGKQATATPAAEAATNIIIQLVDEEGVAIGPTLDVPSTVTPPQLEALVNSVKGASPDNDDNPTLPYAFTVAGAPLAGPSAALGRHLSAAAASLEGATLVTCRPQAPFRVRPVSRCAATLPGHSEAVLATAFSPDGARLATGSGDTTVRLWDLTTCGPLAVLGGHAGWVLALAWSPDGAFLASGGMDAGVLIWDGSGRPASKKGGGGGGAPPATAASGGVARPTPLGACKGHTKWVTCLAWEPLHAVNGGGGAAAAAGCRRLATGSKDTTVKIWDATTRKCLTSLSGHRLAVTAVAWGGEGRLYSASRDASVSVWDPDTGARVAVLAGHGHWVNALALSSGHALRTGACEHPGERMKAGGGQRRRRSGQGVEGVEETPVAAARRRYAAATGGRPERLVTASDDFTLHLWCPAASAKPTARLTGHVQAVNHVAFSPDGRLLASASFDKSVRLWDGETGAHVATLRGHVGAVYMVAWSADSRLLATASKDSTLKVWDVGARKVRVELPGHADEVFALDWAPDGGCVASGGRDRVVRLWRQ